MSDVWQQESCTSCSRSEPVHVRKYSDQRDLFTDLISRVNSAIHCLKRTVLHEISLGRPWCFRMETDDFRAPAKLNPATNQNESLPDWLRHWGRPRRWVKFNFKTFLMNWFVFSVGRDFFVRSIAVYSLFLFNSFYCTLLRERKINNNNTIIRGAVTGPHSEQWGGQILVWPPLFRVEK
jgi:hypothetical protein